MKSFRTLVSPIRSYSTGPPPITKVYAGNRLRITKEYTDDFIEPASALNALNIKKKADQRRRALEVKEQQEEIVRLGPEAVMDRLLRLLEEESYKLASPAPAGWSRIERELHFEREKKATYLKMQDWVRRKIKATDFRIEWLSNEHEQVVKQAGLESEEPRRAGPESEETEQADSEPEESERHERADLKHEKL
ncbi:uncharacterized protein K452DRAFT_45858 [Aplosporella prunicola CBS 121167]|uniref:Uncharacterized protein n=1 Tax=Aplosporella prunicola CBS 121167 TaxID=1176127 RepID=A0A6A6BAA7_9PEZI|nr:uncharacterized protein K452DRAFT_45858 [Aplosporella prunicola CBS 121167]KAF2141139.1 hypothetical protein K452DRAFT_45858 [Aplosporella prunicola CBS 121167]